MQKLVVLFTVFFSVINITKAQNAFDEHDKLLNVGIGVNSYEAGGIPIGASFEAGVAKNISLGGGLDYLNHSFYNTSYRYSIFYLGGRLSYHFNRLFDLSTNKADFYGGTALGYRSITLSNTYTGQTISNNYTSRFILGLYIGGKYYFYKKTSIFLELGTGGVTNARIGLGFKL